MTHFHKICHDDAESVPQVHRRLTVLIVNIQDDELGQWKVIHFDI